MPAEISSPNEKTLEELFAETLTGDIEQDCKATETLRLMATPEVFRMAVDFCKSEDPLKRTRGLEVLGQLGVTIKEHTGPYFEERLSIALELLSDKSEDVVAAAAWSLAFMNDQRAKKALLTVRRSANSHTRHAVAEGLAGETSQEAVEALLELMEDSDGWVREWATFSIGREFDSGLLISPHILEALRRRLQDTDRGTREEAIWGLAIRKDPLGVQMLLKELETDECRSQNKETAIDILQVSRDAPISELRDGLRRLLTELERKG